MLLVDIAVNLTMRSSFLFIFLQQLHLSYHSLIFCLILSAVTFQIVYSHRRCAPSLCYGNRGYYMIAQRYKHFLATVEKYFRREHTRREMIFGLSKQPCNVLVII